MSRLCPKDESLDALTWLEMFAFEVPPPPGPAIKGQPVILNNSAPFYWYSENGLIAVDFK